MSKDKESICVTVRVRPLSNKQLQEDSRICLRVDQHSNLISMTGPNSQKQTKDFYFDSVCDTISQDQMFQRVGKRSTIYCMEGYNCTIFAYGQTGTGKTFTMMGVNPQSRDYFQQRGLIPRTLQHLFQCIQKQINDAGVDYIIKCSFIQIYNEQIIDLLGSPNSILNIRQDLRKGVYIQGVSQQIISQSQQAMEILRKGSKGRHVGSTYYNQTSSRSHSVFTMQIDSQQLSNGIKSTKSRHFHFIDLAGSERTKKSAGQRLKQGCSINKSLHVLSAVISSLAEVSQGKTRHVNYRDSKLTFLLKDSLGGNSKTHLIANISPSMISSLETRSTLMFARKVKLIKVNKVSINQDATGNLQSLKAQIRRLRTQNILLKNKNVTLPLSISEQHHQTMASNPNVKMVSVLQQYVDEELQKQTKFELQITKLQYNNMHLQKGIKHFMQNQKQLRMVISIYEDKIKKMKQIQSKLFNKLGQQGNADNVEQIKEYFLAQRKILIQEIQKFKLLSSSAGLVKNLLRQIKVFSQNPERRQEEDIIAIISKNNEFLKEIKKSILEMEPQMQEGKASKAVVKQNEDLKLQNQQYKQKIQQYGLQLAQSKDKIQQTQNLLNQAISNQINLQKKLQQQQLLFNKHREQENQTIGNLKKEILKHEQDYKLLLSKQNESQLLISQYQLSLSQVNSEIMRIKQRKQFEELNFQEKLQALTLQNVKLQQILKKKVDQHQKLKTQSAASKLDLDRLSTQALKNMNDAQIKIQQLQSCLSRVENQKSDFKIKLQLQISSNAEKIRLLQSNIDKQSQKSVQLSKQIKIYQQQIAKQQQEIFSLKQLRDKDLLSHQSQQSKWQQNSRQLLKMINDKKNSDTETNAKLTQSQLTIIELNQKLSQMTFQNKNLIDNIRGLQISFKSKIEQIQHQLKNKEFLCQKLTQQNTQNKKKTQILVQSQRSSKRQLKLYEQQILLKQQEYNKLYSEMQKIGKKQKQSRILSNELKNQLYAVKKNFEAELEVLKQTIISKQAEINSLSQQKLASKENYQRTLNEVQRKMTSQVQIFKQNQQSIKKAMDAHMINKQKKITEIKTHCDILQEQVKNYKKTVTELSTGLQAQKNECQLNTMKIKDLQIQNKKLQDDNKNSQQYITNLQNDHLKQIQQMELNFNQQCDSKNAQIQKLRREVEADCQKISIMQQIQQENSQLKSELINMQSRIQELQNVRVVLLKDLQAVSSNSQQASNYVNQLQLQLKQKQTYMNQLNQNIKAMEYGFNEQHKQKQNTINQLTICLQNLQLQTENMHKLNSKIQKQKHDIVASLQNTIQINNSQVQKLNKLLREQQNTIQFANRECSQLKNQIDRLNQNNKNMQEQVNCKIQQQKQILSIIGQQYVSQAEDTTQVSIVNKIKNTFQGLSLKKKLFLDQVQKINYQFNSIQKQSKSLKDKVVYLQRQIQQRGTDSNLNLQKVVSRLHQQQHKNARLIDQNANLSSNNLAAERSINQLKILYQRKEKQFQNMTQHFTSSLRKSQELQQEANERMVKIQQQTSRQINKLNELCHNYRLKTEQMKNENQKMLQNQDILKKQFQLKVRQFTQQLKLKEAQKVRNQGNIIIQKQRNEDLQKFIQQQQNKIHSLEHQRERISQQLLQTKTEHQKKLKQSEKRCQMGATQMNSLRQQIKLIQDQASVWKQRMENLQNQIRLSNQRAQKFRTQYMKQKQLNKQFKLLLDNAHLQIQTFKNQVTDKDRLYHQLLQKVSKNDIQRRGLMTQDKKFSDLLEKSRIQVNQMRKKYDDQLKINSILKQQLQKKDVDSSVVKQRSEEYCRKQQQLMQSIRSDYSKIQAQLKSTQGLLVETKKALKKVTLKNEEFQQQIQKLNREYIQLQASNDQLKRETLRSGMDQKQISYVNKIKQENTQLKRQLQKVSEQVISVNQEKLRLKSQIRHSKDFDLINLQLNKKTSEAKFMQKIIDDSVTLLGIKDYKKSTGQNLRNGILQLQRELSKCKSQLSQMNDEISSKNQKLQILQNQKFKLSSSKDEEDTLARMRNKISKASSTFQSIRQSKEEDKLILQMKDINKSNLWGLNKPN